MLALALVVPALSLSVVLAAVGLSWHRTGAAIDDLFATLPPAGADAPVATAVPSWTR